MAETPFDLTVAIVATKNYLDYARDLIESIQLHISPPQLCRIVLFTDNPSSFDDVSVSLDFIRIEVPSFGWPEATLLRYSLFSSNAEVFASRLTMYVDADALLVSDISTSELESFVHTDNPGHSGLCFVRHPGYANRNLILNHLLRTRLGPWESRRQSLGFVARRDRATYFCGGVFWGYTTSFLEFCRTLAKWTEIDRDRNFTPKFHDESYLNRWSVAHIHSVAGPEWAHASQLRHLRRVSPRLSVLVKPSTFLRIPT